jgi:hypothetical protein
MKKKIFGAAIAVTIAAIATLNTNFITKANKFSAVTLSNVEALADGESGGSTECWKTITSKSGSKVMYCGTCDWVDGTYSWVSSKGTC